MSPSRSGSEGRTGIFPGTIGVVLALATAVLLLQLLWSSVDRLSWLFLGAGIACGLCGLVGWKTIAELRRGKEPRGILPWLSFPMTLLGSAAMIPLLLLAVYPEARSWLDPKSLIRARWRDDRLEIIFPRATLGDAINLTLDAGPGETPKITTVPTEHFDSFPGHGEWQGMNRGDDNRRLRIDLRAIRENLGLPPPIRIGINASGAMPQTEYRVGGRIPQQWVTCPPLPEQ